MEHFLAKERGLTQTDWLKSRHSFSFNGYRHPRHRNFGPLLVLNDDMVAPNSGFGMHPHRDMEIITYMLKGELKHQDSTGATGTLKEGKLQYMSAGSGIMHSEINPSDHVWAHLLQIWMQPDKPGLSPDYQELEVSAKCLKNKWNQVISHQKKPGTLAINQDVNMYIADFETGQQLTIENSTGRGKYVYVVSGQLKSPERTVYSGDSLTISDASTYKLLAAEDSHMVMFDVSLP